MTAHISVNTGLQNICKLSQRPECDVFKNAKKGHTRSGGTFQNYLPALCLNRQVISRYQNSPCNFLDWYLREREHENQNSCGNEKYVHRIEHKWILIFYTTKSRIGQDKGIFQCGPTSIRVGFLPNSENIFSYFYDVPCCLVGTKCFCGCKIIIRSECLPS